MPRNQSRPIPRRLGPSGPLPRSDGALSPFVGRERKLSLYPVELRPLDTRLTTFLLHFALAASLGANHREVFCQARFPASLIYALIVSPSPAVPSTFMPLPSRNTSAGRPVVPGTALLPRLLQRQKAQRHVSERQI